MAGLISHFEKDCCRTTMPLFAALGSLNLGIRTISGLSSASQELSKWLQENKEKDAGRFYYRVQSYLEERRILGDPLFDTPLNGKETISVASPNVRKLQNLFGRKEDGDAYPCGCVYVLYDKKGNGKSHAGRALLREFFEFEDGKTIRGMLFSGDALNENIPNALCSALDASSVDGWITLMLLAMDNQPMDENYPSILILDSVNSVGEERANIKFVKALYERMCGEKNMFVVVLTQEKEVAQELFKANGGARIIPVPGSMDGTTDSPVWKEEKWTMDELIQFVHYKKPGKYKDEEIRAFVSTEMTPLDVNKKLTGKRQKAAVPGRSPRRNKTQG